MWPFAPLGGGLFLGWALGANDASNVFGTAVASRIITFRKACLLCSCAVIMGAIFQGQAGIDTYGKFMSGHQIEVLLITSLSAAVTVTLMTVLRLPISTSQAMVGAMVGVGLSMGSLPWTLLRKIILCWLITPVGAMLIAVAVYLILSVFLRHFPMSLLTRDKILWGGLLIIGIYGSYALGANNVANATGIFSGKIEGITNTQLAWLGGISIAGGVLTYSRRVIYAVGAGIMPLDSFTALVAVSSMSITIHIFAVIGVPVSTSQGIVGAILGIGLIRGGRSIHYRKLRSIGLGWLLTPTIALVLAAAGYAITRGFMNVIPIGYENTWQGPM